MLGPIAPTVAQRRSVTAPALVIGHRRGVLHPFSDAENLAARLADARLVQASSVAELWLRPGWLTTELSAFLDHAWTGTTAAPPTPNRRYRWLASRRDRACLVKQCVLSLGVLLRCIPFPVLG